MNQEATCGKPTYAVDLSGPTPALVIIPRHRPREKGMLSVTRDAMADIVRRWKQLGKPHPNAGPSYGTTAFIALARKGHLTIAAQ